jgi:uncharacterized protein (UPF0332 family)
MMQAEDFLRLATTLAAGPDEASWRTAVSRSYYAAFHKARAVLIACGFVVPDGEQAHAYLWRRLSNSKEPSVDRAGRDLQDLRRHRNWADYDLTRSWSQALALDQVASAKGVVGAFAMAAAEPIRSRITIVIQIYERDILRQVTWEP